MGCLNASVIIRQTLILLISWNAALHHSLVRGHSAYHSIFNAICHYDHRRLVLAHCRFLVNLVDLSLAITFLTSYAFDKALCGTVNFCASIVVDNNYLFFLHLNS